VALHGRPGSRRLPNTKGDAVLVDGTNFAFQGVQLAAVSSPDTSLISLFSCISRLIGLSDTRYAPGLASSSFGSGHLGTSGERYRAVYTVDN